MARAMVKRTSSAIWQGTLKEGNGRVSTERGVLKDTPYNFSGRFEAGTEGTNPEELVAAAHASCFSMALSAELAKVGLAPERVETSAVATFEKTDAGMTVTGIHLDVRIQASPADKALIEQAAQAAKAGCPISRLLAPGTKITMDAHVHG